MTYVDQTRRSDDSAFAEPLEDRVADQVLLDEIFSGVDLAWIRADCAIALRQTRLGGDRADSLVAAIYEGLANAVRHGGGEGRLVLLYYDGDVVAHISDKGPGMTRAVPDQPPPPDALSGRGLWMSRQMVDRLILTSSPDGTVLRLEMDDSTSAPPPQADNHADSRGSRSSRLTSEPGMLLVASRR